MYGRRVAELARSFEGDIPPRRELRDTGNAWLDYECELAALTAENNSSLSFSTYDAEFALSKVFARMREHSRELKVAERKRKYGYRASYEDEISIGYCRAAIEFLERARNNGGEVFCGPPYAGRPSTTAIEFKKELADREKRLPILRSAFSLAVRGYALEQAVYNLEADWKLLHTCSDCRELSSSFSHEYTLKGLKPGDPVDHVYWYRNSKDFDEIFVR